VKKDDTSYQVSLPTHLHNTVFKENLWEVSLQMLSRAL